MQALDHTPDTTLPSRATSVASRARPAAGSPPRGLFFSALAAPHYQERIRQQHQRDMMLPALPAAPLAVVQSQLVLQLFVTVRHPPATFGRPHQLHQRRIFWQVAEAEFGRL